jgi:hypothetical protein
LFPAQDGYPAAEGAHGRHALPNKVEIAALHAWHEGFTLREAVERLLP